MDDLSMGLVLSGQSLYNLKNTNIYLYIPDLKKNYYEGTWC